MNFNLHSFPSSLLGRRQHQATTMEITGSSGLLCFPASSWWHELGGLTSSPTFSMRRQPRCNDSPAMFSFSLLPTLLSSTAAVCGSGWSWWYAPLRYAVKAAAATPLLGGAWCVAMVLVSGGGIVDDDLHEQQLECSVLPAA
nr:hypothetical protein Iba_scaffold2113CG0010 [Ipomoea batatas]